LLFADRVGTDQQESFRGFGVMHLARFHSPVNRARADLRDSGGLIGRQHCYLNATVRAPVEDRHPSPPQDNEPAFLDGDFDSSLRVVHRLSIDISPRSKLCRVSAFGLPRWSLWDKISTALVPPVSPSLFDLAAEITLRSTEKSFESLRLFLRDFSPSSESGHEQQFRALLRLWYLPRGRV
jgi:hypothetical protein